MEYKIEGGFEWKMIYTEVKEKCMGDRETIPLSHKVQNGPPHFLNSYSERSLGVAGFRTGFRPQWFMSKGYV